MIPAQLRRDDLLFVLVPAGEKGPKYSGWNLVENGCRYDAPRLLEHLKAGGNLGYYPAPGSSLLNIDVDDAAAFHQAGGDELVGNTYRYSAWPDRHKYRAVVECPDMPALLMGRKFSIKPPGSDKAAMELFFPAGPVTEHVKGKDGIIRTVTTIKTGGQCVGPGSIHPDTGLPYAAFDENAEILTISWADIRALITRINPGADVEAKTFQACKKSRPEYSGNTKTQGNRFFLIDAFELSLPEPKDPYLGIVNGESVIRGANPWHGSSSEKGNVAANDRFMFCFRDLKAHDAAACDAISRGLMQCLDDVSYQAAKERGENPLPNVYNKEVYEKHFEILKREFPLLWVKYAAKYAARKAAEEGRGKPKVTISGIMNQGGRRYVRSK